MKKRQEPVKVLPRIRGQKSSAARSRTYEEVRAANLRDPFHAARLARLARGEHFDEVSVHPDCEGGSHWIVEWGDSGGGCQPSTGRWASSRHVTTSAPSRPDG